MHPLSRIQLTPNQKFDLVIIGAGIYGIWAALDASQRGLSTLLLDKGDFGGATSSNHYKIIHGGLRYLQHLDLKRFFTSVCERKVWQKIAPHLIQPIPFVLPTYREFKKSKSFLNIGLTLNDQLSFFRNNGLDKDQILPSHANLSKNKLLELFPEIEKTDPTGACVYYDCQIQNTDRLNISILKQALQHGASAYNYAKVIQLNRNQNKITGVTIQDVLTRQTYEVGCSMILNTAGPWSVPIQNLLETHPKLVKLCKSFQILTRPLFKHQTHALALEINEHDAKAVVSRGGRLIFITPWKGYSLIGNANSFYEGDPDHFQITSDEINTFIEQIKNTLPNLKLATKDVLHSFGGLQPIEDGHFPYPQIIKKFTIIDHSQTHNIQGMISIQTEKYTTARKTVVLALDLVLRKLGKKFQSSQTDKITLSSDILDSVGPNHPISQNHIQHAIHNEKAVTLSDIILRRTEIGAFGKPSDSIINSVAQSMAKELHWTESHTKQEIDFVFQNYANLS